MSLKVMSYLRMSFMRTCLMEGHVLRVNMYSGGQVLQEDMSNDRSCLVVKHHEVEMSYMMT